MLENLTLPFVLWSLVFVGGFVLLVFEIYVWLPRHWDGRWRHHDERWERPERGRETSDGLKRLMPLWIPATAAAELFLAGALRSSIRGTEFWYDEVSGVLVLSSVVLLALFTGLAWSVFFLNRPKLVVAPHYREQPGVFSARWRERRSFEVLGWLMWTVLSIAVVCVPIVLVVMVMWAG